MEIQKSPLRNVSYWAVFTWVVLVLTGCTEGQPKFGELDPSMLPQPTFAGKVTHQKVVYSFSDPILVDGECDSRIDSLLVRLSSSTDWSAPDSLSSSVSIDCKNNQFRFTLKSLTDLGLTDSGASMSINLEVKGVTVVGASNASQLKIQYLPGALLNKTRGTISSAGGVQKSGEGTYITHTQLSSTGSNQAVSSQYKLKLGPASHSSP